MLRDLNNLPFKALFESYKSQNNNTALFTDEYAGPKDPAIPDDLQILNLQLLSEMQSFLRSDPNKAFLALGKLSDMAVFNGGSNLLSTHSLSRNEENNDHLDRGREEAFRNLVQLLTLKGSVFSIYLVAQAGDMLNGKFIPRATTRLVRKVELSREYPVEDPLADLGQLKINNTPSAVNSTVLSEYFIQ